MCRRRHEGSLPQQLQWQCHREGSRRPIQPLRARTPSVQLKQYPPAMALPCQLASLMARPLWPTRLPVLLVRTASFCMQHVLACSIAVGHELPQRLQNTTHTCRLHTAFTSAGNQTAVSVIQATRHNSSSKCVVSGTAVNNVTVLTGCDEPPLVPGDSTIASVPGRNGLAASWLSAPACKQPPTNKTAVADTMNRLWGFEKNAR
jgi:hypothetical protein